MSPEFDPSFLTFGVKHCHDTLWRAPRRFSVTAWLKDPGGDMLECLHFFSEPCNELTWQSHVTGGRSRCDVGSCRSCGLRRSNSAREIRHNSIHIRCTLGVCKRMSSPFSGLYRCEDSPSRQLTRPLTLLPLDRHVWRNKISSSQQSKV